MKNESRFHRGFPDDLASATHYYDRSSRRLGDRFRANVKKTLARVVERPESFGFISERGRAAIVRSFPYVILFRYVDGIVFLGGLFHVASDPQKWSDRLDVG